MISVITFYTPEYTEEATQWRRTCNQFLAQYPFKSYEKENQTIKTTVTM